jgi:hypothetical protein
LLAACLLALPPFGGFGFVGPSDDGGVRGEEDVADLGRPGAEEFPAHVEEVEPSVGQLPVQAVFQAGRVIAEDHGVQVVVERSGGIAGF